jgi:hypothetical protein
MTALTTTNPTQMPTSTRMAIPHPALLDALAGARL